MSLRDSQPFTVIPHLSRTAGCVETMRCLNHEIRPVAWGRPPPNKASTPQQRCFKPDKRQRHSKGSAVVTRCSGLSWAHINILPAHWECNADSDREPASFSSICMQSTCKQEESMWSTSGLVMSNLSCFLLFWLHFLLCTSCVNHPVTAASRKLISCHPPLSVWLHHVARATAGCCSVTGWCFLELKHRPHCNNW